jgi:hypothetical protein
MKQKGQLLSLDFLLAIALIILGFGVALKFGQLAIFEWQEKQEIIELETYGKNAVLLLLSNPQLTCEIKNWQGIPLGEHVNNCLDVSPSKDINQAVLGLPSDWNFNIFNKTDGVSIRKTRDLSFENQRVFSVEVKAIVHNGAIPKGILFDCLKKKDWLGVPLDCSLQQKTVWVRIWKK